MTDKSRAAAKAEEVLSKMQTSFAISATPSTSSAEVDNILGQIKKEATGATKPKHMQVIGLEEEVRLKEATIKGLYVKIAGMTKQLCEANEKIESLEKAQEEKNKELEEEMTKLKEKNESVLKTAKEHQKGWKAHIKKIEQKASDMEKENRLIRSKMAKLMRTLEGTIEEFSDLSNVEISLSLASSSESEVEETVEEKNDANEDSRDDCEQDTQVKKGVAHLSPSAAAKKAKGFFKGLVATNE
jgi:chromosome segregation ATPase